MKKSIWIILPIVIIAVVVVAVFASQRSSLSAEISQLQADKADLTRQLSDAGVSAKSAQETAESDLAALNQKVVEAETLAQEAQAQAQEAESKALAAETRAQEAESKISAAETKAEEAAKELAVLTAERDNLQGSVADAAQQLTDGIKQAQIALEALVGPANDELSETKAQLDTVTEELNALKAASQEAATQAAVELQQVQEALDTVTKERDELKVNMEKAAAQVAEMKLLQVAKAAAVVSDSEGKVVKEYADISEMLLDELQPGYTITIIVYNAAGEEAVRYDVPYTAEGNAA